MRHILLVAGFALIVGTAGAQELYTDRLLGSFGLEDAEIERVLEIEHEATAKLRVERAELEVRKAELARLLVEESPNRRLVERNLRESAEIEIRIRLIEIERELAIRDVVGTQRWSRIVRAMRARRVAAARADAPSQNEAASAIRERLVELQRAFEERGQQIGRVLRERGDLADDEELREQLELLREGYLDLQELIRERL